MLSHFFVAVVSGGTWRFSLSFFLLLFSSDIFVYNHHHSEKTLQVNGNGENLYEFDINQYCSHIWFSLLGILACSLQWMVLTKWPNLEQCLCKMSYDFCARFTITHCKLDEPTIIWNVLIFVRTILSASKSEFHSNKTFVLPNSRHAISCRCFDFATLVLFVSVWSIF